MSNDAIPYFDDGDELTCTATAAVTGKTFVKISGNVQADGTYSVAPAGAGDIVLGVAAWDAAQGALVTVRTIEGGLIMPVTAGAALAANTPVMVGAGGKAVVGTAASVCSGICLTAAASAADAQILLSRFTLPA